MAIPNSRKAIASKTLYFYNYPTNLITPILTYLELCVIILHTHLEMNYYTHTRMR